MNNKDTDQSMHPLAIQHVAETCIQAWFFALCVLRRRYILLTTESFMDLKLKDGGI